MNFLAHTFLSFHHTPLILGNLATDFIRGSQNIKFSPQIQKGIKLHYAIDDFTDQHAASAHARSLLRPSSGKYAGVFLDIIYDYFLSNDPHFFPKGSLYPYSQMIYRLVEENQSFLPSRFLQIFPYMKQENWLYNYRTVDGIRNSFSGVVRRAKYLESSQLVFEAFLSLKEELETDYQVFMPEMVRYAKDYIHQWHLTEEKNTSGS